ncbi:DUF2911 domain-containing protein [Ekhidna sp.]|uniref:DUF2911 domain-containing protein n=1 Tax=Ekhidna sp. TaxID=2608089 RepID=UPI0032977760
MKTKYHTILYLIVFSVLLCLSSTKAKAQKDNSKRPSPPAIANYENGVNKITIDYSRPSTKGRAIFGGLVEYGNVWRTGANESTTIEFNNDVIINGERLPAGKYGLFTIPDKDEWIVIFNKKFDGWGAFEYKSEEDVLRTPAKPSLNNKTDIFTIEINQIDSELSLINGVTIDLMWGETKVSLPVELTNSDNNNSENSSSDVRSFPWSSIPQPSDRLFLSKVLFQERKPSTLKDINEILLEALAEADYNNLSYFDKENDFVFVCPVEQFKEDGSPEDDPHRFNLTLKGLSEFSLKEIIRYLFNAKVGRYRILVFVISDDQLKFSSEKARYKQIMEYTKGSNKISSEVESKPFTDDHYVNVLVYEFRKSKESEEAKFVNPGEIKAKIHLNKADLFYR